MLKVYSATSRNHGKSTQTGKNVAKCHPKKMSEKLCETAKWSDNYNDDWYLPSAIVHWTIAKIQWKINLVNVTKLLEIDSSSKRVEKKRKTRQKKKYNSFSPRDTCSWNVAPGTHPQRCSSSSNSVHYHPRSLVCRIFYYCKKSPRPTVQNVKTSESENFRTYKNKTNKLKKNRTKSEWSIFKFELIEQQQNQQSIFEKDTTNCVREEKRTLESVKNLQTELID